MIFVRVVNIHDTHNCIGHDNSEGNQNPKVTPYNTLGDHRMMIMVWIGQHFQAVLGASLLSQGMGVLWYNI